MRALRGGGMRFARLQDSRGGGKPFRSALNEETSFPTTRGEIPSPRQRNKVDEDAQTFLVAFVAP